ncbi:MAG TPA: HNH endonuclease family protein [Stackebrandtia sp.]|uniref:HNH endonuclease family protein n=1 Tax=Stackebrandtia sp. TaxID=2023065 RepID=UPI002D4C3251|nr:HNH endonuclease family protein [Stackebrandtia sp.]HZE38868.1 HNH endonuclease family protein [Stackebrandtia sp.]
MPVPKFSFRHALVIAVAALAALALISIAAPRTAQALPADIPSKATVQSELNGLTVATEGSMTGYSRDKFPTWITISGTCNTREWILKRDADQVTEGADCYPTSGTWYSYYDGVIKTDPSQVSIDHVVALAEAWRSGASSWTTARRQDFANDVNGTQLLAVDTSVNSSKGDRDPASWKPPRTGAYCLYSKLWIHSKSKWGLKLQSAEKTALQSMLNTCSY